MLVGVAFLKLFSLPKKKGLLRWHPFDFLQTLLFSGLACIIVALQFWRDFKFSVAGLTLSVFLFLVMRVKGRKSRTLN